MLVLSRKVGERVHLVVNPELTGPLTLQPGEEIGSIVVVDGKKNSSRLGCEFPATIRVLRNELSLETSKTNTNKKTKETSDG
jgi:sRNA-binding carbon storage regulator CsrA